jgi:hypothetical protein
LVGNPSEREVHDTVGVVTTIDGIGYLGDEGRPLMAEFPPVSNGEAKALGPSSGSIGGREIWDVLP